MKTKTWILGTSLALAACGGGTTTENNGASSEPAAKCVGGKCDASSFEPVKGGIWAACHVAPGEDVDLVKCDFFSEGELVAPSSVSMTGVNAEGVIVASGFVDAERRFDAEIRHETYPLDLRITLGFRTDSPVRGFSALKLTSQVRLQSAGDLPESEPFVIEQPFEVWPVQIATDQEIWVFNSDPQTVEADFVTDEGEPRPLVLRPNGSGRASEVDTTLFAVPVGAEALTGKLQFGAALKEAAVVFEGPGQYVVDADGLRPATADDADMFQTAPDPVDPGSVDPEPQPEPTCSVDYTAWLATFEEALAKSTADAEARLAELACTPTDGAAFAAHHALFRKQLDAALPGATSSLDDSERARLRLVVAAVPDATDAESYTTWFATYDAKFKGFAPESTGRLDERETEILDVVGAARPKSAGGDVAYAAWYATFEAQFRSYAPLSTGRIQPEEATVLDALSDVRPHSATPETYASWFADYAEYFDQFVPEGTGQLQDDEAVVLRGLAAAKPTPDAVAAYGTWLTKFSERFGGTGMSLDDAESRWIAELVSVKPCVSDLAAAEELLASQSVTNNATVHAEHAAPRSCDLAAE